ncbi:MAG: hypothetical protein V4542_14050 [Pseudomonadota bacterium]
MELSPDQVTIKELTVLDARYWWRIDWLGDVYKQKFHHAQHMIEIFLSPVYSGSKGVIVSPSSADSSAQVRIELGVGYLPMLYIGAVFQAGKVVHLRPEWVTRERRRVCTTWSKLIPLNSRISRGHSPDVKVEPLLSSEFRIGPRAWPSAASSHILATPDDAFVDPHFMMIPSIELARFFFCTSSVLARSLFADGWESLIWREKCDLSKMPREITIGLRTVKGLKNADALHLAYKLLYQEAEQQINSIRQSLQSTNSANPRRQPIPCAFPFDEEVEIEAEVVRIPTGTILKERFFVTRLLNCHRPIPFDICYVHPMLHPGQGDNRDSPDLKPLPLGNTQDPQVVSEGAGRGRVFENISELEQKGLLSDDEGGPANTDESINITSQEIRFPGLGSVATPLSRKDTQEYKSAPGGKPFNVKGKGVSTGNPAGSTPIVPANIETDLASRCDETVAWLRDAAPLLRDAGYTVGDEISRRLDIVFEDQGRSKSWTKISYATGDGKSRFKSRLLVALPIAIGEETAVVAEIERKSGEHFGLAIFFLQSHVNTQLFFDELAADIARRNGWPIYDPEEKQYTVGVDGLKFEGDRGFHTFVTNAKDIAVKIDSLLQRRTGL